MVLTPVSVVCVSRIIPVKGTGKFKTKLKAGKPGEREIVVGFHSTELGDVHGHTSIVISKA